MTRNSIITKTEVRHKKRPGVISKCKTSKLKSSKHYQKAYRGQGR